MIACKNFKDIRFYHKDGLKVYRRGIVNKTNLRTQEDFVVINHVSLPFASKFISIINIEVYSQHDWKFVKANDYDTLNKI